MSMWRRVDAAVDVLSMVVGVLVFTLTLYLGCAMIFSFFIPGTFDPTWVWLLTWWV